MKMKKLPESELEIMIALWEGRRPSAAQLLR